MQYFLKIQLDVELAINTLQECHDTGAAQLKRLKSAQKVMKKHLPTLQDEIAMGSGLPRRDEQLGNASFTAYRGEKQATAKVSLHKADGPRRRGRPRKE